MLETSPSSLQGFNLRQGKRSTMPQTQFMHIHKACCCHCRGFQLQRGERNTVPTVQGVLERVLCQIRQESRETLRMQTSGRTDAGVHAKGQVISILKSPNELPNLHHHGSLLTDYRLDAGMHAKGQVNPNLTSPNELSNPHHLTSLVTIFKWMLECVPKDRPSPV